LINFHIDIGKLYVPVVRHAFLCRFRFSVDLGVLAMATPIHRPATYAMSAYIHDMRLPLHRCMRWEIFPLSLTLPRLIDVHP